MRPAAPARGLLPFLGLTFALSWIPAWWLRDAWIDDGRPLGARLLASATFYAVCMGWQPLLAVVVVRRWMDPVDARRCGLRPARRRFMLLAGAGPLALALLAVAVAALSGSLARPSPAPASAEPSPLLLLELAVACAGTLSLLWAQTLAEEIGWRGYFLPRVMQRLGAWRGLAAHGLLWGVWYAPILLLASGDPGGSAPRTAGFVLTCVLLGTLLGWLRLASRSIAPTTVFNLALTVVAGLPFLIQGADVGLRGSAYGPAGWLPMAAAIAVLASGPCRRVVARAAAAPRSPRWAPGF